jgi:hypothetical protein
MGTTSANQTIRTLVIIFSVAVKDELRTILPVCPYECRFGPMTEQQDVSRW